MTGRVRKAASLVARVGPRPRLLASEIAFRARRRRHLEALRREYETRIATPRGRPELRLPRPDIPPCDSLPRELQASALALKEEADAIVEHRVSYLGSPMVWLGDDIDWHRDFKSGYRWPAVFYQDVEVTRLTDDSDAKVPWELSRGHQLLTLSRAARLFPAEAGRFGGELEAQIASWLAANPPGIGINWVNAMEVGLRAVNIIWALGTLGEAWHLDASLQDELAGSLQAHARHIEANLEGSPALRSNHYLADLLGLLALGWSLHGDDDADRWLSFARRELEEQIVAQVHPDGVGFEASLSYHGLVLEMLLLAHAIAADAGAPMSERFDTRLRRMLAACRGLRHPDGRVPQIGDNDSGRVLPAGFERPPTYDPLLDLGCALIGEPAGLPGACSAEVAWTLGLEAWERADAVRQQPGDRPRAFPHAGLYVLAGAGTHVVVDCGDVGQNGNGGHSHNDLLSYEASFPGTGPLVVDSGTYAYTADPSARNEMRATAAHNGVEVGAEEINPFDPGRLFAMPSRARPVVERFNDAGNRPELVATHDGYARLAPPVLHRRTVSLKGGALDVADELEGSGSQAAAAHIHLAEGTKVVSRGPNAWLLERNGAAVTASVRGATSVRLVEGWASDRYGRRVRAPVLRLEVSGELPLRFGYRLEPASGDIVSA